MSTFTRFKTLVFALCCFAVVSVSWSRETSASGRGLLAGTWNAGESPAQGIDPLPLPYPEGKITRIEGNKVTLLTVVETKDTRDLRVGNNVQIKGGRLTKVAHLPIPIPYPGGTIARIDGNKVTVQLTMVASGDVRLFKVGGRARIRESEEGSATITPINLP